MDAIMMVLKAAMRTGKVIPANILYREYVKLCRNRKLPIHSKEIFLKTAKKRMVLIKKLQDGRR